MKKSELKAIIKECICELNEVEYVPTITITKRNRELEKKTFNDESSAKAYAKKAIKKYNLTKQRGFWGNSKEDIEMTRNF